MHEMMLTLFKYNSWAMARMFEALHQLKPNQFATVEASDQGSIRDTLAHMLAIQWGWYSWFDKSTPVAEAYARTGKLLGDEISTIKRAEARWKKIEQQTETCLDKLDDDQIKEIWSFKLSGGISGALPLWQMMLHVANHQTHTRGQILAALRRVGYKLPNTDLLSFVWSNDQVGTGTEESNAS